MLMLSDRKITSREIADITGKRHADVMEAIRTMEEAWVKVGQRNFPLTYYTDQSPTEEFKGRIYRTYTTLYNALKAMEQLNPLRKEVCHVNA